MGLAAAVEELEVPNLTNLGGPNPTAANSCGQPRARRPGAKSRPSIWPSTKM